MTDARLLLFILPAILSGGCGPRSALRWHKLRTPYHERVALARQKQLAEFQKNGEPAKSQLQQTEEALRKAVAEIFDGREAELKRDTSRPLAALGLREWRVEELILLYHPDISSRLVSLDQMAAYPNLILAVLDNLKGSASSAITGGIFETQTGTSGNVELVFNESAKSRYDLKVGTSAGLKGFFKDAKTHMAFERQLMQFYHQLMKVHKKFWDIVEGYAKVDAKDRALRSKKVLDGLMGR